MSLIKFEILKCSIYESSASIIFPSKVLLERLFFLTKDGKIFKIFNWIRKLIARGRASLLYQVFPLLLVFNRNP